MDQATVERDPGEASTARLYRAILGARQAEYYLAVFARFDERGRSGVIWNSTAAMFNLIWLICAGLWGAAGLFAILMAACGIASQVLWLFADGLPLGVKAGVSLAMLLVLLALPGLYGTALLHAKVRQRMFAAVQRAPTLDAACEILQRQARKSRHLCAIGLVGLTAGVLALVAARRVDTLAPTLPVVSSTAPKPTPKSAPQIEPVSEASAAGEAQQPDAGPFPIAAPVVSSPPDTVGPSEPVIQARVDDSKTLSENLQPQTKGFGVAVGRFAVTANAQRVVATLTDAGLPVLTDSIESAGGTLTRVRVGPFAHLAQAEAAAQRVRALRLEALIYSP